MNIFACSYGSLLFRLPSPHHKGAALTDTGGSVLMNLRLVCDRIANGNYEEINELFAIVV